MRQDFSRNKSGKKPILMQVWAKLTTPLATNDEDARREYMTRVVLVMMAGLVFPFTVIIFAGWLADIFLFEDFLIMEAIFVPIVAGIVLAQYGYWKIGSYTPPLIFFFLGCYGTFNNGFHTTFMLSYAISILLASMLLNQPGVWIFVIASLGTHIIGGQVIDQYPSYEVLAGAIPYTAFILGIAVLFHFSMHRLQSALLSSRKNAMRLQGEISERQQAESELVKRNRELMLLNHVLSTVTSSFEVQEILTTTLRELVTNFEIPHAGAALIQKNHTHLIVVAQYPEESNPGILGELIPIEGNPSTRYVIENRKALAVADAQSDPRTSIVHDLLAKGGIASILRLPLVVHDQVLGTIGLDSPVRREFSEDEIVLASNAALVAAQAIQNANLYAEVQRLAIRDDLTDLLNRRGLFEFGEREFERARRFGRGLTVLFMDVDDFKAINDQHGHRSGDIFLHSLGELIAKIVREIDLVGRYGGDEFIVLLTETDAEHGCLTAERLRYLIQATPLSYGEDCMQVSVSIGMATIEPGVKELAEMVERADQALYRAKKAGGNRVVQFS